MEVESNPAGFTCCKTCSSDRLHTAIGGVFKARLRTGFLLGRCDERGVGFAACLAEKPTALWSCHSMLWSDETWLPEWSGKLGGVEWCAVRSRGVSWGKPVFRPSN